MLRYLFCPTFVDVFIGRIFVDVFIVRILTFYPGNNVWGMFVNKALAYTLEVCFTDVSLFHISHRCFYFWLRFQNI